MSRVSAAFVCALCDPDNPRPASIMCSNNCGRYVCAVHAVPRKGPGSAMICLSCAEALGLLEKPKPQPVVTPIVSIPSVEVTPQPAAEPIAPLRTEPPAAAIKPDETLINVPPPIVEIKPEPAATPISPPAPKVEAKTDVTLPPQTAPQPAPKFDPDATLAGIVPPARPAPTQIKPSIVIPTEEQSPAVRRLVDPPMPPQASETIVSQRGNTLQVPKVTATLPRPPQSTGATPRVARRTSETLGGLDRQLLIMAAGSIVLGIAGFVMILAALAG
ncbi:MAG: hypothetical protein HY870_18075 [Chloroflexi bacterium]|nr:hypothetical protein [Chloroflexota bacterium]